MDAPESHRGSSSGSNRLPGDRNRDANGHRTRPDLDLANDQPLTTGPLDSGAIGHSPSASPDATSSACDDLAYFVIVQFD